MGGLEQCALWGLQWGVRGNAPSGSCYRAPGAQHSLSTAVACVVGLRASHLLCWAY